MADALIGPSSIRRFAPADAAAIRAINEAAFGGPAEADLVERLRARADTFELVAIEARPGGDAVVGHILFSPVAVTGSPCLAGPPGASPRPTRLSYGLAPMAVPPAHQSRGIGSRLVEAGLDECRRRGVALVVVLGHPRFYPRFGFVPASRLGLRCKWPVPDEVFMALRLGEAATAGASPPSAASPLTLVHYLPEFNSV
jgi:putative acetyltransferase